MTLLRSAEAGAMDRKSARGAFPFAAACYFGYAFVGTHPLADTSAAARLDGSPIDRLAVVAMFVFALAILWPRRRETLDVLASRPGFVFVSALAALSVVWSGYPDLTARRAILYLMLSASGLAVAVSARDPARLHRAIFVCLTAIIAVNCLATLAAPGTAITDIGVKGIYTQKNVAGGVAMVAFITGVFWTAGAPDARPRALGLLALAMILGFLIVTKSKTSLALAVLVPTFGAFVAFAARGGRKAALAVIAGMLLLLVALFGLFAASGFDTDKALDVAIGDSSFTGRDELWAFARREIAKRPWGGQGYGAFWDVGLANDPIAKLEPGTWLGDTEVGTINQAHNGYLDLSLNLGVPAAAVGGLTILAAFVRALRRAHAPGLDRRARAAHGAFAALAFAFLIHNATEATLFLRGAPLWALLVVVIFAPAKAT